MLSSKSLNPSQGTIKDVLNKTKATAGQTIKTKLKAKNDKKHKDRLSNKEIRTLKSKKKKSERQLREIKQAEGIEIAKKIAIPNRISALTVEQDKQIRTDSVLTQINIMSTQLPNLLRDLSKIKDIRNPKTLKHKLTVLLLYGILCFVFHVASRREANREMTEPQFKDTLQKLFPELESMPPNDTLKRLLENINVLEIENAHINMIKRLVRGKKFKKYLVNNCYPIAIDGTQKLTSNDLWDEDLQQRTITLKSGEFIQYYVYVLEANLVFKNGMSIPLLSEFLKYSEGDKEENKQDCELRAFKRLAEKLHSYFPNLAIILLLDGLYSVGPVIKICNDYKWQYMIVLQDGSLSTVWRDFNGLLPLQNGNSKWSGICNGRVQEFYWVNEIEYEYGTDTKLEIMLNMVVCEESWEEIDKDGQRVKKHSKHVWLSSRKLCKLNVEERCNSGARFRWGIEESNLKEKHQGYNYEHCFCKHLNALMGYHYLMRLAHALNELVHHTVILKKKIQEHTIRGFVKYIFETCKGLWLTAEAIEIGLKKNYRYQLN